MASKEPTRSARDAPDVGQIEQGNFASEGKNLRKMASVSEAAEVAGGLNAPFWLRWLEWPFHVPDPTTGRKLPEACGWAMDSAGRGPLNSVGGYVGSAVIRLASESVGCVNPRNCDATVLGVRPSSLLTLTTSVVGVVAAILMPIVGALVDHTEHRKAMGILSGFFSFILIGMQISISRDTWLFVLVIDGLQSFALLVHTTSVFAYLPDLTLNQEVLSHYTSRFNLIQFASVFVFVSFVLIAGNVRGTDKSVESTVQTARDGTGIAFGMGALCIGYSWLFLFRRRPALSEVPDGSTLLNTGFVKVARTARKIWKDYGALKWFMISLLWSPEAGAGVVLSMAVTFLTVFMRFSGQDIAKTQLILVSANLFGSLFSKPVCRWINPLNSYRLSLFCMALTIAGGVAVFEGPEKRDAVFGFSAAWGFTMGWVFPSQRVLLCTLIPKGQETEMMGLFVFTGQVLGWLPPLIFTIMNQQGINMRWGLSVVVYFCVFAVICTFPMGSYKAATEHVMRDSEAKLDAVMEATSKGRSNRSKETDIDRLETKSDQSPQSETASTKQTDAFEGPSQNLSVP